MNYETFDLPVTGGTLRAAVWGTTGPVVLCSHGITASHVSFEALVDALGEGVRVVAPDHRGRGGSRGIAGPWGIPAHAEDLVAVLDYLGIGRADVLVGHSMGGFVSVVTAARFRERIGEIVLVDGGIPPLDEVPVGATAEELLEALIGPAMKRLEMTFASREAYRDFWREHPALSGAWSPYVEHYLDYDLVGEPPELRPSASKEAVVGDMRSQTLEDVVPSSLEALRGPVRFLRAPRGIFDDAPLYPEERLAAWAPRIDGFSSATIPNVNHYTILLAAPGAGAVAAEVRALLPGNQ